MTSSLFKVAANKLRPIVPVALISVMSACGGGTTGPGGGPTFDYTSLFDTTSTESSTLTTLTADGGGAQAQANNLDRADNSISLGGFTGTINGARNLVTFDGGAGTATITDGSTDYVALFMATPASGFGDPFNGIIGVPTDVADLPSSAASFSATDGATVLIISGTAFYDLIGDVSVDVDFEGDLVGISISALNGTVTDAGTSAVSNVGTVEIMDAILSGVSISGGDAELTSTIIEKSVSASAVVTTAGSLFGPTADEVGGSIMVDDAATNTLEIRAFFLAD